MDHVPVPVILVPVILRGFGPYPGYHFYITRDGTLYYCRPVNLRGCHAAGHNAGSLGICYEGGRKEECRHWRQKECQLCGRGLKRCPHGLQLLSPFEDNRTAEQVMTLHELLSFLHAECPEARLLGHRDLPGVAKACPCLDARHEYEYIYGRK